MWLSMPLSVAKYEFIKVYACIISSGSSKNRSIWPLAIFELENVGKWGGKKMVVNGNWWYRWFFCRATSHFLATPAAHISYARHQVLSISRPFQFAGV